MSATSRAIRSPEPVVRDAGGREPGQRVVGADPARREQLAAPRRARPAARRTADTARPNPNACTTAAGATRYSTGGRCADREISQADVASSPTEQAGRERAEDGREHQPASRSPVPRLRCASCCYPAETLWGEKIMEALLAYSMLFFRQEKGFQIFAEVR